MIDIKELEKNLLNNFSYDEVFIFLNNFTEYIGFDKNDNFIIDVDNIYKWIGYTQKVNAKRAILRVLSPNTQYIIEESDSNREIIKLTPNAFKELCMFADTTKAKCIRKFYMAIEDYLYKNIENKLLSIEAIEKDITTYINRSNRDYPMGNTVYIVKECGLVRDVYKVGSTINMRYRERAYHTSSNIHIVVYTKICKNHKEVERLMHKKFIDYKYMNRLDWFKIPFSKLRQSLDELQTIQDNESSEYYINTDALDYDNILVTEKIATNIKNINDLIPYNNIPLVKYDNNFINTQTIITKGYISNFSTFISECFDIDKDAKTAWIEITSRYRLWARSTKNIKNDLAQYLKMNGFPKIYIYDSINNSRHSGYSGLKLRPLSKFININRYSSLEKRFLNECCEPSITGHITIKQLREKYFEWRKNKDEAFNPRPIADMIGLKELCNNLFVAATIYEGSGTYEGYYGLHFKMPKNIGRGYSTTSKEVEQLDSKTGEIIATYNSMRHAARELGAGPSTISVCVSSGKEYKGFLFRLKYGTTC